MPLSRAPFIFIDLSACTTIAAEYPPLPSRETTGAKVRAIHGIRTKDCVFGPRSDHNLDFSLMQMALSPKSAERLPAAMVFSGTFYVHFQVISPRGR